MPTRWHSDGTSTHGRRVCTQLQAAVTHSVFPPCRMCNRVRGGRETCPHCQGERWICEEHPALPWPHGECAGPGVPCPACNATEPPQPPPDFVSLVCADVEYDAVPSHEARCRCTPTATQMSTGGLR
jgi:hypothetical protein